MLIPNNTHTHSQNKKKKKRPLRKGGIGVFGRKRNVGRPTGKASRRFVNARPALDYVHAGTDTVDASIRHLPRRSARHRRSGSYPAAGMSCASNGFPLKPSEIYGLPICRANQHSTPPQVTAVATHEEETKSFDDMSWTVSEKVSSFPGAERR
ncbi:hypothetical protein CDAR_75891 [Caerostris darwini]|uniref:Uncharacterized protein n=1 Tax=Caerostris darwini TaxID=1538125 RepID=A0AAV4W125_9ARAC|nr:hypothetical protein CDAR_75891 [Caerostris darwini]